ncbi:outer membrane beta-barrel protein [Bradyrhizobium sp. MOS003]|uniref:outer membrane protein n=1 Tax=Bradyrhizobium sp. MOS003 TaxID=2133946 RepID=UPI00131467DD|nr:outer membrane beta-barrel protein [Bradyrhizobium sp. MOS003]
MRYVAVAAALAAAPAYAGEAPAHNWTGVYIGANIGGGWASNGVGYAPNDPQASNLFFAGGKPAAASFDLSGVLGGVQLGYNHQLGSAWLIGVEADFEESGVSGSGSTSGVFAPYYTAPFNAPVQQGIEWFGTVRARLGFLPTSNLLAYGTAGFAYGRVGQRGSWDTNTPFAFGGGAYDVNCFGVNPSCFAGSSSKVATGWTAGAGLEYAVLRDWTLRAEYLHVSLAGGSTTETVLGDTAGALPSSFNAAFGRVSLNTARIGLSHQFR